MTSAVRLYYQIKLLEMQHDVTYQLGFITLWAFAQLAAGSWIACSSSIPKLLYHIRKKPLVVRLEAMLRLRLQSNKLSSSRSENRTDQSEVRTIGGGGDTMGRGMVNNVEFNNVVNETRQSVAIRADDKAT